MIRLVLAAVFAGMLVTTADAATVCATMEQITKNLDEKYHETPSGIGVSESGVMITVWVSEAGTWTITTTSPDGMTCIRSYGNGWEAVTTVPGNPA